MAAGAAVGHPVETMSGKSEDRLRRLSRLLSHALRHDPNRYGLTLAADGSVAVDELLAQVRRRIRGWRDLSERDLERLLELPGKRRFAVADGRIRARYGHSVPDVAPPAPVEPPGLLLHGTTADAGERILAEGLSAMQRRFVHLSVDRQTALAVARRRTQQPVILTVLAGAAHAAGVRFHPVGDDVWLCQRVPPEFLRRG